MKKYMIWFHEVTFQVSESTIVAHEEEKCVPRMLRRRDGPRAFLATDFKCGYDLRKAFHSDQHNFWYFHHLRLKS